MKSLYIHIPFCARKCLYCDFYSIPYDSLLAKRYVNAVAAQIQRLNEKVYTVYIGGGTPTSLENNLLEQLVKALGKISGNCAEFTIEANPESLSKDKIRLLRNSGINRLSLGIQSFNDAKLKTLGRIHSSKRATEAVSLAAENGFNNISIDLIFGGWNETIAEWQDELKTAVELPVKHISCYSLTYENNTPLYKRIKAGNITPLPDSVTSAMYRIAMDYLPGKKFMQYEISNFAQKGFECKHNLHYWENNQYLGIGASAASFIGGIRTKNISDAGKYLSAIKNGKTAICFAENLPAEKSARETAAIKIRTKEGIDFRWFKEKTGFDFMMLEKDAVEILRKNKLIEYTAKRGRRSGIKATRKGFLFCDNICAQLL